MADITAQEVKRLRDATGAGMMDCKKALVESDGDYDKAVEALRKKGLAKAAERADRENREGAVALATGGDRAALVQLKSETDFTAKNNAFLALVQKLADAVLSDGEGAVDDLAAAIEDLKLVTKENIEVGKVVRFEAAAGNALDTYVHVQDGRGVNAVIIEGSGIDQGTLHEIALHIAFAKPIALTRDEVPADLAERERATLLEITKSEGKPEAAWDKIVDGRIAAWYKERVLLDQGIFGEKETVRDKIGTGSIVRFAQAYIGS
ncbi:MAG: translation elongation factor Ts [Actinobacteria bacterium]|jgi:elongation factor Ts|nr:MAG: translation elongation factor Ts [Actinomycetota bacterium]